MVEAIITHSDIDGAAAAGIYLYLRDNPESHIFITEPYLLHRTLKKTLSASFERILIMDLGINPVIYNEVIDYLKLLRHNNTPVEWFDHHVWEEKWIKNVRDLGVNLYIDQSTCATGVVVKYVNPIRSRLDHLFVENIVKGVCAGDLWTFNHWLGPFFIRLVRRRDSNQWRKHVIKRIANGITWTDEFESKIIEHIEKELDYLNERIVHVTRRINNYTMIIAESNETIENSFLAAYLIGRYNVDIAALISIDGKLSFRSRSVNVRDLATHLGGGGHLYASGAK
ncbi:MAG: DHHA1 domain-containing protein, partial [Desulfurococcaceae archaeon]